MINPFGFSCESTSPQPVPQNKPIISSTDGTANSHDATVGIFLAWGYGIGIGEDWSFNTVNGQSIFCAPSMATWANANITFSLLGRDAAITYAATLPGLQMVVYSGTGLSGSVPHYPQVELFQPMGNNAHVEITLTPNALPNVITTGGRSGVVNPTPTDANENAYGNGLKFYDLGDPQNGGEESSWSNGYIAGKFLYIKRAIEAALHRECGWWEIEYRCSQTTYLTPAWTKENGYGQIVTADAIAYMGSIPNSPYPIT